MSEERGKYLDEVAEDHTYQIRDEAPHDYFTQIPNLVDELNLTPHAYRLYGHLRRVAGETGKCWQSTKTLAKSCNMSMGKISEAKQELENTFPPLIRVVSKTKENGIYHEITISDIWSINHDFFTGVSVHIVKTPPKRSHCENPRSQYETKKNPIKQEPSTATTLPDNLPTMPIEWQIAGQAESVVLPDETHARRVDFANLVAMGTSNPPEAYMIAMAFQDRRDITMPESKVKGQRKAIKEMLEMGVTAEHVRQAVGQLMDKGMTVADFYSVSKTAIDLANKPQKEKEYTRLL